MKGKKPGKVTITAKVGKKKYKCKVIVKKKVVYKSNNNSNNNTQYVPISVKESIAEACMAYGDSDGEGTLYKLLLDNESAVVFTSSNMSYSLEIKAEKLTTSGVKLSLLYFDAIMKQYGISVTHNDLGFDF